MKGYTMRTSATLLAAAIAAVLITMGMAGPSSAGQVLGMGSTAVSPAAVNMTGSDAPQVLLVKHDFGGDYRYRHGDRWRWGYNRYYTPYWGYKYYPSKSCYWNGYSYVCYNPSYDYY